MNCKCGCGLKANKGRMYILGHNHKGKTYTDIYGDRASIEKEKRSEGVTGIKRPDMLGDNNVAKRDDIRQKISDGVRKSWKTPEGIERLEEMKSWRAAYMNSFVTNPSKPQIELYNMVLKLCPYAILNYPCGSYSIDIAIPFLNIAIEYDEPYWHQDVERDKKRQMILEEDGWNFKRFETIPLQKEIEEIFKC